MKDIAHEAVVIVLPGQLANRVIEKQQEGSGYGVEQKRGRRQ